jgi:hypothetical protein
MQMCNFTCRPACLLQHCCETKVKIKKRHLKFSEKHSVADPDPNPEPDPSDPYDFGPP